MKFSVIDILHSERYKVGVMNIITVIPLTNSKVANTLSYFTSSDIPVGALVSVPLRSKNIHAVVTESRVAADLKAEIKSAPYEIRKLGNVKAENFFPITFVEACKKIARYYVGTVGAVIDALTSDAIIENMGKMDKAENPQASTISRRLNLENTTYAVQGDDPDRISSWRSLIRQEFAKKKSVVFYVPTINDTHNLAAKLTKGIEDYIFILNSALPKKKIIEIWKTIGRTEHPVVVIATASFAVLPRADFDTIVIERENGRGWVSQRGPYIDLRHALEIIAHMSGQIVYRADSILRIETLRRVDEDNIIPGSPFKWRSISLAKDTLIDMRLPPKSHTQTNTDEDKPREKKFRVLSPELETLIRQNHDESTHMFIYTVRRGLSSTTVCDDCERIVTCIKCGSPVVLHTSKNKDVNFHLCHVCGERQSADVPCTTCGGWRLSALGIGIERVEEEIRSKFPDIDLFKIDADSTTTSKQIDIVIEQFRAKPGSILIGTEIALSHIRENIEHTAIVSLDSLFALPDFRMAERIIYTITRLRMFSSKSILVQTRRIESKVFDYGLEGNISDFYRGELEERKQFAYPPYKTLIKISIEGPKEPIARLMADIKKMIEPYEVDVFPAFTASSKGNSIIHGLLRIDPHQWPDNDLIQKFKTLPPIVSIKVDPENLL